MIGITDNKKILTARREKIARLTEIRRQMKMENLTHEAWKSLKESEGILIKEIKDLA